MKHPGNYPNPLLLAYLMIMMIPNILNPGAIAAANGQKSGDSFEGAAIAMYVFPWIWSGLVAFGMLPFADYGDNLTDTWKSYGVPFMVLMYVSVLHIPFFKVVAADSENYEGDVRPKNTEARTSPSANGEEPYGGSKPAEKQIYQHLDRLEEIFARDPSNYDYILKANLDHKRHWRPVNKRYSAIMLPRDERLWLWLERECEHRGIKAFPTYQEAADDLLKLRKSLHNTPLKTTKKLLNAHIEYRKTRNPDPLLKVLRQCPPELRKNYWPFWALSIKDLTINATQNFCLLSVDSECVTPYIRKNQRPETIAASDQ